MRFGQRLRRSESGFDVVVRTEQERRAVYSPSADRILELLMPVKPGARIVRGPKNNSAYLQTKITQKLNDRQYGRQKQLKRASITPGTSARKPHRVAGDEPVAGDGRANWGAS